MKKTVADYPEITAWWHPLKNGDLRPSDVSHKSRQSIWWQCPVADDHEWTTPAYSRTDQPLSCPFCRYRKVSASNCLAVTRPDVALQWHSTKNDGITVYDVVDGSGQMAWWQCPVADDHEWRAKICDRKKGSGCPYCRGLRVAPSNCLATTHPEIASQWHRTKNGTLTARDVVAGCNKRIWWQCPVADDHEWFVSPDKRTREKTGCPCCCGFKVVYSNCLATIRPDLALQWHPTKNGDLTPDQVVGGNIKVWWQCFVASDHEWETTINNRKLKMKATGCPCCSGHKVVTSNCLATTHPEIAAGWHQAKNGTMTPQMVTGGRSRIKAWWICDNGHQWKTTIRNRIKGGCPKCNESKGEKAIAAVLRRHTADFKQEVRYPECRYKRPLPFDFVVNHRGKTYAIEFQGEQHYKLRGFDGKSDIGKLKAIQNRDSIKRMFCEMRSIPLLEIPYWQRNKIDEIVSRFLGFVDN